MRETAMLKETLKLAWYKLARGILRIFCHAVFRLRVHGLENVPREGAFILACNHQSYLDPAFCGTHVRNRLLFLARDSLFSNWFFGPLIRSVNAIPVKRDQSDIAAIKKVIATLRQGQPVCLFPEGTRTNDGRIAPVKPGFGLLCRRGRAPIIPVVIDGAFECWPRHRKLFRPGCVRVCYGPPISVEQVEQMGDEKLAQYLTDELRRMQNDCRQKCAKPPFDYADNP